LKFVVFPMLTKTFHGEDSGRASSSRCSWQLYGNCQKRFFSF
jgi:hypothetical protein